MGGQFHVPGAHGFAGAAAGVMDSDASGPMGASNWSAYDGAGHQQQLLQHHQQQQLLQQQQHQQQLYQQHQQLLQHQHQQQIAGRRMVRGGRPEGDEWGWFVDAGENEQQVAHPPWGVRRSAQD